MKKLISLASLMFVTLFSVVFPNVGAYAQNPCDMTNSIIINTGYDGVSSAIGIGATDPYWTIAAISSALATIASPVTVGSSPYAITPHPLWVAPAANSRYLSCITANGYNTNNTSVYQMTIRRTFKTCLDDDIFFDLHFAGDDTVQFVSIDGGAPIYTNTSAWSGGSFAAASTTIFLPAGTHTIDIGLSNWKQTYTNNDNYYGIDVYGTVSSAAGANSIVSNTSDPDCMCSDCGQMTNLVVCADIIGNPFNYTFTPTVSPITTSFNIDFGDGSSTSSTGNTPINHTYASGGSYIIEISILNADGEVCDIRRFSICIPDADGDARHTQNTAVDYQRIKQTVLNPYPNPANSTINVPVYGVGNVVEVVLLQLDGKVIQRIVETVRENSILKMSTSGFTPGVYYIKISDALGQRVKSFTLL